MARNARYDALTFWVDRELLARFRAKAERETGRTFRKGLASPTTDVMRRLIESYVASDSGTVTAAPSETTREAG